MRILYGPVGTCSCGKKSFATKADARRARKHFRRRHSTLFVYHSVACDAWHLTSQRPALYSPRKTAVWPRVLVA